MSSSTGAAILQFDIVQSTAAADPLPGLQRRARVWKMRLMLSLFLLSMAASVVVMSLPFWRGYGSHASDDCQRYYPYRLHLGAPVQQWVGCLVMNQCQLRSDIAYNASQDCHYYTSNNNDKSGLCYQWLPKLNLTWQCNVQLLPTVQYTYPLNWAATQSQDKVWIMNYTFPCSSPYCNATTATWLLPSPGQNNSCQANSQTQANAIVSGRHPQTVLMNPVTHRTWMDTGTNNNISSSSVTICNLASSAAVTIPVLIVIPAAIVFVGCMPFIHMYYSKLRRLEVET